MQEIVPIRSAAYCLKYCIYFVAGIVSVSDSLADVGGGKQDQAWCFKRFESSLDDMTMGGASAMSEVEEARLEN